MVTKITLKAVVVVVVVRLVDVNASGWIFPRLYFLFNRLSTKCCIDFLNPWKRSFDFDTVLVVAGQRIMFQIDGGQLFVRLQFVHTFPVGDLIWIYLFGRWKKMSVRSTCAYTGIQLLTQNSSNSTKCSRFSIFFKRFFAKSNVSSCVLCSRFSMVSTPFSDM